MSLHESTREITDLILAAAAKARQETDSEPEPGLAQPLEWPVKCTVGPGLEGAIACETRIGYVNGAKGWLIYRGYDIFELCANCTFEEVAYLLLHDRLPNSAELAEFKRKLFEYSHLPKTTRQLMGFPVEDLNTMAALRLGTLFMRQKQTLRDTRIEGPGRIISSDEDSIPMETSPAGGAQATYEFTDQTKSPSDAKAQEKAMGLESCYRLIAGVSTVTATIARLRQGHLPIEPRPDLGHAANFLYMMTGRMPTPEEERVMDVALILHADHGMNASTFAAMVVASTLSDIYFSIGAGIAALNGPLHGGANEQVLHMLREIGAPDQVKAWYEKGRAEKRRVMGFGHRVYKAYDPRARVFGPLAKHLVEKGGRPEARQLLATALELEKEVIANLGQSKGIFPNVDFYSGIVYMAMGIPTEMFTPIFAVSRVAGWTARVLEYLENNRIFRPRAMYLGEFDKKVAPLEQRG